MAESLSCSYDDELSRLQERLIEVQRQNEALKLQNEISTLERQIGTLELTLQQQPPELSIYDGHQTRFSSTPRVVKRKMATPLDVRRQNRKDVQDDECDTTSLNLLPRDTAFHDRKLQTTKNVKFSQIDQTGNDDSNRKRSIMMKPATYDGTSSWIDYKAHFEACCEINKWTEREKGLYLSVSLRGQAQGVFGNLTNKSLSYDELVHVLEERFAPPNQTELYRTQLRERRQKASESLSEMGQDIRRLTNLAYASAPSDVRETLAKEQFIDSLISSDMRLRIKQSRPSSLNDAVRHAVELEAFNRADRTASEAHGYMRTMNSTENNI